MKKSAPVPFLVLVALVVAILGGWTAFWFWSANKAETLLDQTITHQLSQGREIACEKRTRGGFPFRLEFDCEKPAILLDRGRAPRHLSMDRLQAVTQVWDPGHIIYGTGPLVVRIGEKDAPEMARANWGAARASAKLGIEGFNSASFVVEEMRIQQEGEIATLQNLTLHHRPSGATGRDLDLVAKVTGLNLNIPPLQGSPFDVEAQLRMKALLRLPYTPAMMTLREWQQAGGSLDVVLLRIDQGESTVRANGLLSLTREGRPEGSLEIKTAAIDQFIRKLGVSSGTATAISAANLFAKPVEIDGKRGVVHQLRFANGNASLGPISLPIPGMF